MNLLEEFKTELCSGGSIKSVGKAMLETIRIMRRTYLISLQCNWTQQPVNKYVVVLRSDMWHARVVSKLTIRQDTPELPWSTHSKVVQLFSYRHGQNDFMPQRLTNESTDIL